MAASTVSQTPPQVIDRGGLSTLIRSLAADGYQVIGPRLEGQAVVLEPVESADELPAGVVEVQDGGSYRLEHTGGNALFDHVAGPHSWKRYLFPPLQRLWKAERRGQGFVVDDAVEHPAYALLGVRPCDLAAIDIQEKVFDNGDFTDPSYRRRRDGAFIVAVNCGRAGGTCFCASMGTGPRAESGFDLALTELVDGGRHDFLLEAGSDAGRAMAERLGGRPAADADIRAARARSEQAAASMGREMVADVADLLKRNLEHPQWDDVASRCLSCANCTMVCPTCFCSTVEDVTDLSGNTAERWRSWDSCFTLDHSYIHGGAIRRETRSRYRQWMTHKLSTWHEQFGVSGCTGCGRCITWCPVAIDITQEARVIRDNEGRA